MAPPDTTGDLGLTHYVQWVNLRYAVYTVTRSNGTISGFNLVPGFARQLCAQTSNSYGSLLPSDLEGTALPPSGAPNSVLSISSSSLLSWKFSVNWSVGSGTPTVRQQGTLQPSADYRWMGSAAMDKTGGIAIGYSVSNSTTIKPSVWYAFRSPSDPLGTIGPEAQVLNGPGCRPAHCRAGETTAR